MRVRVPATRDFVETSLAEHVKATTRLLDRLGQLPPKPEGLEDILDHMMVSIDPYQSLHAMPALSRGFSLILGCLNLEILHNETGDKFLTTDNPVIYFDPTTPEAKLLPYQVRPPIGSIELLFPIDPQTVLRGYARRMGQWAPLKHVRLVNREAVRRINRLVARFGYRFVFACDNRNASVIRKYAAISPVLRADCLQGPGGKSMLFHEWVFGRRPTKPKWQRPVTVAGAATE